MLRISFVADGLLTLEQIKVLKKFLNSFVDAVEINFGDPDHTNQDLHNCIEKIENFYIVGHPSKSNPDSFFEKTYAPYKVHSVWPEISLPSRDQMLVAISKFLIICPCVSTDLDSRTTIMNNLAIDTRVSYIVINPNGEFKIQIY